MPNRKVYIQHVLTHKEYNRGTWKDYPNQPVSGLDALRHLVESSGKTRATVAAEAGLPESTLSRLRDPGDPLAVKRSIGYSKKNLGHSSRAIGGLISSDEGSGP